MADTRDRLAEKLTSPIEGLGLDLEAVDLSRAGKRRILRVAIDKDGGVTMDDIADATREVSHVLDETNLMGAQPYTLEVSSPGVERPLTLPRHWRRNIGRLVKVILLEGEPLIGRITESDDDGAMVDVDGAKRRLGYAEVKKAKIQIEFKKESP
ncbi:MAG: ribosome maturation factor RimP [Marmoricola sp.]